MYSPDPVRPAASKATGVSYFWPSQRLARALLIFPLVTALLTTVRMLWDGETFLFHYSLPDTLLLAWNLLAPLGLATLILQCARRFPSGLPVTAVACVVYTLMTIWLLLSEFLSESSMAGFLFLSLPLKLLAVVAVFAVAAIVYARRRDRSAPTH